MILASIAQTKEIAASYNIQPFMVAERTGAYTLADFWITTFGAPDESVASTVNIEQVIQDALIPYDEVDSLADSRAQSKSFYFDFGNQLLSIHLDHRASALTSKLEDGRSFGFSNKGVVYLDDIFFAPCLKTAPSIAQDEDQIKYDKLAYINGTLVLDNTGGHLDFLLEISLFGNDVRLYYLEEVKGADSYSFNDVIAIASLYVENYAIGQQKITIKVQDKRKAGNVMIPSEFFSADDYPSLDENIEGQVIPLAFGLIRASAAVPVNTNTTGSTIYRQAQVLTSLGIVQVKINGLWVTKTPTATDLPTGSFTLASGDSRSGDQVYECRVLGSVGIDIDHASDIIKYLNNRYLNLADSFSNYDTAEWASAEAELEPIGIVFDEAVELSEAIRRVQSGANIGFRYEINATGKHTIRIDDDDRSESFLIQQTDIKDLRDLGYETEKDMLAAAVVVKYAPDFESDESLLARNVDNYEYVRDTYRLIPTLEIETYITEKAVAEARAAAEADRYKDVQRVVAVEAMGSAFMSLRIFDIGTIELTTAFVDLDGETVTGRRPWLGVWKVKVVGIDPDLDGKTNRLRLALLEKKF